MTRPVPRRTWIGLAMMIVSQSATFARVEPFHTWNTPLMWTGYILLADGVIWKLRGNSWLSHSRPEFVFLACASIPLWLVFEFYNVYAIRNWYYVGLPEPLPLRYLGYAWSFATIWPAIFETGELIAALRHRDGGHPASAAPGRHTPGSVGWISVLAGALMLAIPLLYPSPFLAAPVFLGFAFLLDPLNARAGAESILGDVREGRYARFGTLLLAGLVCGMLWEFWNFWAGAKWIYTVPILPEWRIFEMPILGYGGFPPFAVECFAMYAALRRLVWRAPARPISI